MSKAEEPERKRRRFQFSLRTLLLLVLLVAIGFSWIGTKIQRAAQQWKIARERGFPMPG